MRFVKRHRESSDFPTVEVLCQLSPQGVFRSMSPGFARVTGWDETEWLGKPIQSLLHPDDVKATRNHYSQVFLADAGTFEGLRFLIRGGGAVSLTVSFVPRWNHGAVE